jgi:catechol 2,3-dioxygenase-like lactoylglutathione lyase family enzyme
MVQRVDHVGIFVDDLAAAKTFLVEKFGFTVLREAESGDRQMTFLQNGDAVIEFLYLLDPAARAVKLDGATARIDHIALEMNALGDTLGKLEGLGVKPDDRGIINWGERKCMWTDSTTTAGVVYQLIV